jgi:hypothetical protein
MAVNSKNSLKISRDGSSLICKEGCRFSLGWCMREPYCPLSSAVCNATIPELPLFEMAESACSPFCYVLHYLSFIKFTSAFYHACVIGQLLTVQYSTVQYSTVQYSTVQYSKFAC